MSFEVDLVWQCADGLCCVLLERGSSCLKTLYIVLYHTTEARAGSSGCDVSYNSRCARYCYGLNAEKKLLFFEKPGFNVLVRESAGLSLEGM